MIVSEILNITESLNSRFDKLFWEIDEYTHSYTGYGKFDDSEDYYRISIDIERYVYKNIRYTVGIISFMKYIQNIGYTSNLLKDSKNSSKVFGSIYNCYIDKLKVLNNEIHFNMIAFTADSTDRINLYRRIMDKGIAILPFRNRYEFKYSDGYGIIGSNSRLNVGELTYLKELLSKYEKELI